MLQQWFDNYNNFLSGQKLKLEEIHTRNFLIMKTAEGKTFRWFFPLFIPKKNA